MKTHIAKLSAVLALLAIPSAAHAATLTWTNTSGGNWSDTNNWSPNQIPTNTDNTLITTPGTYTVVFDLTEGIIGGIIASNLTVGAGGGTSGVQTLLITNLFTYSNFQVNNGLLVTNGGLIAVTNGVVSANPLTIDHGRLNIENGEIGAPVEVENGGVLDTSDSSLGTILVVTNQGVVNASGGLLVFSPTSAAYDLTFGDTVTVAEGGVLNIGPKVQGNDFTITAGGTLNIASPVDSGSMLIAYKTINNSGTIVITNGELQLMDEINEYGDGLGELVNLPGGVLNLQGNGNVISAFQPNGYESDTTSYVTNMGTILATGAPGATNIIYTAWFDNHLGSVTNSSGVLQLGIYQTNLVGNYFAAPGATIQFEGADLANENTLGQITPGTPLVLGGSGQYQLTSGYLFLPGTVPSNLELQADSVTLGSNFQGGSITNLFLATSLNNVLPVTGVLTMNNAVATNLVVASGGVVTAVNSETTQLTVNGGGVATVNGFTMSTVQIARRGTLNVTGAGASLTGLTNSGILNLQGPINYSSGVLNEPINNSPEVLNEPGGVINLSSNASISVGTPSCAFVNQGAIVQNAGAGNANSISYQTQGLVFIPEYQFTASVGIYAPCAFDTSQGTVTNLSGTLILPSFGNTLSGTFFAAAGATIQLGGGATNAPLPAGTPLTLSGPGQFQFFSGYLYLATNTIPNLALVGGQLELGPSFQDGAITNLVLNGITLTNQFATTLPVTGNFTVLNSGGTGSLNASELYGTGYGWYGYYGNGVYGNYTVAGRGVLTASNAVFDGNLTLANGGTATIGFGSTMQGNTFVNSGGTLNVGGTTFYGVTVASGGLFNSLDTFFAYFGGFGPSSFINGPLTNAGTINLTNSGISFYNDGTTNAQGCLINQAGGLIDFRGNTAIGGSGGYDYVANQGRIINSGGSSFGGFDFDLATNAGTITAETGQMVLGNQLTLLPSGSLNVVLNSATNYGSFIISSNFPSIVGNVVLAGAFNATLNAGYVPTNGTTFNVLSYGSFTGSFSSLGLPSAASWQSNYGGTNFTLVVGSPKPQFGTFNLSGTNLIYNGLGGPPGSNYVVLVSTNLALPLTNWTALATNTFDGSGQFHYTNHVSPAKPRQFFIFKLP